VCARARAPCSCTQAAVAGNWTALLADAPAVFVTGSSTFESVLEALAVKGLHRVYVVDGEHKPLSIITLTDVLRLITKPWPRPSVEMKRAAMEEDDGDDDDDDDEE
jgi:CBS-domain-containing membrane protein